VSNEERDNPNSALRVGVESDNEHCPGADGADERASSARRQPPPQVSISRHCRWSHRFCDVEIKVNADGSAESVRVVNAGPPGFGFENAAKSAATGWRFAPTPPATVGAGKYIARFDFRPNVAVPIARWEPSPKTKVSFVEPGHVLWLSRDWVRTPRWFSDFTFELEYRLLEQHTVAAVVFHAQFVGRGGDYAGYEVLLTDQSDGRRALGRVESRGGLKYREVSFDESVSAATPKAVGEWHKLRVEAANGGAQVVLNGALLSAADQFVKQPDTSASR
jgi:TonB family protein